MTLATIIEVDSSLVVVLVLYGVLVGYLHGALVERYVKKRAKD